MEKTIFVCENCGEESCEKHEKIEKQFCKSCGNAELDYAILHGIICKAHLEDLENCAICKREENAF